jgi:uncharacterized membrane protein
MSAMARILLTGVFALLPIALTVGVTVWVAELIRQFGGPGSFIGRMLISVGLGFAGSETVAYLVGLVLVLLFIFILGLMVETSVGPFLGGLVEAIIRRIPLLGQLYDMAKRFTSIVDPKADQELKSMSPVWCFFGGEGSAAVLALLPSPQPVTIGGEPYVGVLVPSAPVPFGGALIYVPTKWVKPAEGGVENLMNVYVSMGVTQPKPLAADATVRPAVLPPH